MCSIITCVSCRGAPGSWAVSSGLWPGHRLLRWARARLLCCSSTVSICVSPPRPSATLQHAAPRISRPPTHADKRNWKCQHLGVPKAHTSQWEELNQLLVVSREDLVNFHNPKQTQESKKELNQFSQCYKAVYVRVCVCVHMFVVMRTLLFLLFCVILSSFPCCNSTPQGC